MPITKSQITRVSVPAHIYIDVPTNTEMSEADVFAVAAVAVKTAADQNGGHITVDGGSFDDDADPVVYPVLDNKTGSVSTAGMGIEDRRDAE